METAIQKLFLYVEAVLSDSGIGIYVSHVVRCPSAMDSPKPKIEDTSNCQRDHFENATTEVRLSGLESKSCTTDSEGRCSVILSNTDRVTLFSREKPTGTFWVGGGLVDPRLVSWTIDEKYQTAKKEYLTEKRRNEIDAVIQKARDIIVRTKSTCAVRTADPSELKVLLFKLVRIVVALKKADELPADLAAEVEEIKEPCKRHVPELTRQGLKKTQELRPSEALEYFSTIKYLWPDSKIVKDQVEKGAALAEKLAAAIRPQRIKDVAAYSEGDGVVMYYSLVNNDGEYTAVPGKVYYEVYIRNHGIRGDVCYQNSFSVDAKDFKKTTVGLGYLSHEILMQELPFTKWREMSCYFVKTYLQAGIAELERMDFNMDFLLRIRFQTEEGDTLESVKEFRP